MASTIKSDNGVSSGVTGIVQTADSTGQLALQTTTSGGVATTAVTIDNSQNVGVGVTPSAVGNYRVLGMSGVSGGYLSLQVSGTETSNIYGNNSGLSLTAVGSKNIAFWNNSVNTMTLDNSGCLFVGGTSSVNAQYKIQAQNSNAVIYRTDGSRCILSFQQTANTPQTWNTQLKADASQNWYMISNSSETVGVYMTPSASGWNNLSDERAKENWVELTNALENVNTLRAGTHTWIKDKTLPRDVGLIAQDVLKVLPEAVDTSDPDNFGVRYTHLVPMLVKAIQELSAEVTALKAKVGI